MDKIFMENVNNFFDNPLILIDSSLNIVYFNDNLGRKYRLDFLNNLTEIINSNFKYRELLYFIFKNNFIHKLKIKTDDDYIVLNLIPIKNKEQKFILCILNNDFEALSTISDFDYREKMLPIEKLTSTIVHDINNVIAGVSGTLSLMEYKILKGAEFTNEEMSKYVNLMTSSVNRITETLDNFRELYISRETKKREISVPSLLESIKSKYVDDEQVEFKIIKDEGELLIDYQKILKSVDYIIQNAKDAIEFKKNGTDFVGEILFTTDLIEIENKIFLEISIRDNGIGIDKKMVDNIFEPYFSIYEQGNKKGLGLTLADYNVIKSGGFISVNSVYNEWTEVKIYLPIKS